MTVSAAEVVQALRRASSAEKAEIMKALGQSPAGSTARTAAVVAENVASLRRHEAKRNQEEEARALEQFAQQRMARKSQAKDPRPAEGGAPARQREAPTLPKMSGKRRPGGGLATLRVIKKPKQVRERKAEDGEGAGTVGNNRDAADAGEAYAAPAASNGEGVGGILGYVAYSDSDSDSDSNSGDDGDDGGGSDKAEQKGKT